MNPPAGAKSRDGKGVVVTRFTAVVMAGSRGPSDPVASATGKSHKCLVEVAGQPMLTRVLDTLESSPWVDQIILCIESSWSPTSDIERRISLGGLRRLDAAGSPASSALRAFEVFEQAVPLLIVTADHPLLSGAMIEHFCARALACGDVGVAVARAQVVLAQYPQSSRTLLRFSDGERCGCNMFALNNLKARRAVAFWTQLEAQRKRPWRLVSMLGLSPLLKYLAGRLTLGGALDNISRKLSLAAGAVEMPFADAAIDVDKPSDLALVETILQSRQAN